MMKSVFTILTLLSVSTFTLAYPEEETIKPDAQNPDSNCVCVTYYNCLRNNTINKYGVSVIDIRLGDNGTPQCENIMDVCCNLPDVKKDNTPLPPPKKHIDRGCGYRNRNGIDFRITGDVKNIANEGEFPWMVLILKKEINSGKRVNSYKCGGSLINKRVVLTGAHCVDGLTASQLVIRAGEWDTSSDKERLRHQDRKVYRIIKHPQYDPSFLGYDFALIILQEPFTLADNVEIICLPESDEVIDSKECIVTGWGKDKFGEGGIFSSILKAVTLPTVPSKECQNRFRKTRLSQYFELHPSFICAGGVPGYDACQGDGGSPLICPLKQDPQRYLQAGVVAWGIGCNDDIPAAYANVALVRTWIDETLQKYHIYSTSYTPRISQIEIKSS